VAVVPVLPNMSPAKASSPWLAGRAMPTT
jgi:hypothetical protein